MKLDKKRELLIYLIFGASDYTKIKVQEIPTVGQPGELVVKVTRFVWVLMSPEKEAELNRFMSTKTSIDDY